MLFPTFKTKKLRLRKLNNFPGGEQVITIRAKLRFKPRAVCSKAGALLYCNSLIINHPFVLPSFKLQGKLLEERDILYDDCIFQGNWHKHPIKRNLSAVKIKVYFIYKIPILIYKINIFDI